MKVLALSVIELSLSGSRRGGTAVYIASLAEALQEIAEVDICILKHEYGDFSAASGRLLQFEIDPEPNILLRHFNSWRIGVKTSVWRYNSKSLRRFLQSVRAERYDAAVFLDENAAVFGKYLPAAMPKILVRHNLDSQSIKLEKHSFTSLYRTLTSRHLSRRFDRWTMRLFAKTTIGTEAERKILAALGSTSAVSLLPTISRFDVAETMPECVAANTNSCRVVFLGDFKYQPNTEAVHWFIGCQDSLPPDLLAKLEVILVGRAPPEIPDGCRINIRALGFVDDLFAILSQCQLAIIPIISGSGVKVKALTLLASGLPVITTSEGVSGINVVNGVHCLIADDQKGFSEAIARLVADPGLGHALQKNARALIRENFSAQRQNEILARIIGEAITLHKTAPHA